MWLLFLCQETGGQEVQLAKVTQLINPTGSCVGSGSANSKIHIIFRGYYHKSTIKVDHWLQKGSSYGSPIGPVIQ
jgi:hypothetical protein